MQAGEGFRGTKRFVVEGCLGAGGMGVVHRARDLERGEVVALKTMSRVDPETLLRFKKEFRSLADISHPNVVQLYELFSEGDQWFFTMELVDGVDLLTWGQSSMTMPPPAAIPGDADDYAPTMLADGQAFPRFDSLRPQPMTGPPQQMPRRFPVRDVARLRDAFRQLARGLIAIHNAGKLHRDVKPPNVIVTRSGRVVLLDFGVASDFAGRGGHGVDESMAGTPAYMAPEQASLRRATPASDWYAMGVVLYEALTTRLPFEGSAPSILFQKQRGAPPPPSKHLEGVPPDLERLAMALLNPDPRVRPTGEEILAELEGERVAALSTPVEAAFVGRHDQLRALHDAFEASAGGRVVVMLHGPSGMGKSALASRFLGELSAKQDALVLSGRCYEREAVPFKAVDSVVDELRHWLSRLPREDAAAFLPHDLGALVRVFPVLGHLHVDSLYPPSPSMMPPATERAERAERAERDGATGHELRRRAFVAFRELLTNIARAYRLVVHIDDLQWCDADSVQLLESLFGGSKAPWLLLCTHRSEDAASCAPLADLRKAIAKLGDECKAREIDLRELSRSESDELARALVDADDPGVRDMVTAEACGNPLFLAELARWANERVGSTDDAGHLSLEHVILDRVARLTPEARLLLETLSVAGGPIAQSVAARAAALETLRTPALALRSARMVVTRGLGNDDPIEIAHARIRDTIKKSLAEDRRKACHAGIARALAAHDTRADLDVVFEHFLAAGDLESAKSSVLVAAEAAEESLAFLRAAALYRHAIRLRAGALGALHRKLGDAFANAERLGDAADAYLAGAAHASANEALELRILAAEDYLKSGRDERGLSVLVPVLEEVDLPYPRSQKRALASILWHEAKLRTAPLRRRLRSPQSLRGRDLVRIDVAYAASTGLSMSDPMRGADYASRGLWLALEAGEPVRTCRALAVAAGNTAARGEGGRKRAEELARAAQRIAQEIDEPRTRALAHLAAGIVHFLLGEWRGAISELGLADGSLRESCRAVAWELATTQSWSLNALILVGDLQTASVRAPGLLDEARGREDRFATMHLVYSTCISRLAADDVAGALEIASVGRAGDPGVLTAGQWAALLSACSVDRYRGDAAAAWQRTRAESKVLEKSMLWQSATVRTFSCYERGLSAIAAAAAGHDRRAALRAAEGWARALGRERLKFAPALGHLIQAGASAARGNRGDALRALDAAIPALETADLGYLSACARHRKGELLGGDAGKRIVEQSSAFFSQQGIVRPERCLAMSAPGFPS
ncbi:MAG: protein kinase [Labilithrix sp.]|nr:protein kinase [Labilithrix sp.]